MSLYGLLRRSVPIALLAASLAVTGAGADEIVAPADHAVFYVASRQEPDGSFPSTFGSAHARTADAIMSLVAAGRSGEEVDAAMGWLEANIGSAATLGQKAKIVLAAVAAGRDPRDVGGSDLVQQIADAEVDGVYESSQFSQVYDQALALLALDAAGAAIPRRAVVWLAEAQCPDGGWQFDLPRQSDENRRCRDVDDENDFTESDTNTTGLVLQALAAVPRSVTLDHPAFDWLYERQDDAKGGWGFDRTYSLTDSASTAIVLQAFAAYDRRPPRRARRALRDLQRACPGSGGFARGWVEEDGRLRRAPGTDFGNTVASILGLVEEPLPVEPKPYLSPTPDALACAIQD